jgi:DNA repair exonuclease SbcCD nuclease subunit
MFTLVHAADLHLETTFTDVRGGAARRAALADAFVRIVDLARDRGADALTFGGDLFEAERAGPQTARFLFEHFARFGKPIFIAPGNHDPFSSRSLYARDDLPANVRVFAEPDWSAFPLADDLTLYGFGHTPADPPRPFANARFDRPGTRIALFHGSDENRMPPNKRATAPFTLEEIAASGATLALAGHFHGGYVDRTDTTQLAYPGSPEPIKFGERGTHGALLVRVEGPRVSVEPIELARTRLLDVQVDLSRAGSEHAIGKAVEDALGGAGSSDYVRMRLRGALERGTRLDRDLLVERYGAIVGGIEMIDETTIADYAALGEEPNVRGHAIADLLAQREAGNPSAEGALRALVAAFDGSEIAP